MLVKWRKPYDTSRDSSNRVISYTFSTELWNSRNIWAGAIVNGWIQSMHPLPVGSSFDFVLHSNVWKCENVSWTMIHSNRLSYRYVVATWRVFSFHWFSSHCAPSCVSCTCNRIVPHRAASYDGMRSAAYLFHVCVRVYLVHVCVSNIRHWMIEFYLVFTVCEISRRHSYEGACTCGIPKNRSE